LGRWPDREELLSVPGLHLHDYCKAERAGRKIGHLSLTDDSREALWERGRQLLQLCGFEPRCGDLERALAWPGAGGAQV
jgi:phosphoribosylaminoimidazole carboxylase (NCAIR synthetase)